MALYRFTMIFNQAPYGWSESYFATYTTPELAVAAAGVLAPNRMRLCPSQVKLLGIRVSSDLVRGDAQLANHSKDSRIPTGGTFRSGTAAETESAYMIRLETAAPQDTPVPILPNSRRILLLRGIPEDIIEGNDIASPLGQTGQRWMAYLAIFLAKLQAAPETGTERWQLRVQTPWLPGLPINRIESIQVDAVDPRFITVTMPGAIANAGGFVGNGDKVLIRGVGSSTHINGLWVVQTAPTVAPFAYRLGPHRSYAALRSQPLIGPGGTMNGVAFAGSNITSAIDLQRITTRETGRPFGQPAGRRKTR